MLILAGGTPVAAVPGDTILSALKAAMKNIHSICGGRGMCGTCRVAVAPEWLARLPAATASESRLLRVLKGDEACHRLACQTVLDVSHHGLSFMTDPPLTKILTKETV